MRGVHQVNAFILQQTRHRTDQRVGVLPLQREQQLGQFPIRANRAENFVVLHLAGHHRAGYTFLVHQLDRLAQFAEAHPVQSLDRIGKLLGSLFL